MIKWFEKQIQEHNSETIEKFYFFLERPKLKLDVYYINLKDIDYMERFEFVRYVNINGSIPVLKYKK